MVTLELHNGEGVLISENRYWLTNPKIERNFLQFNDLGNVELTGKVIVKNINGRSVRVVEIINPTKTIALGIKLNLREAITYERVLPAYFSDGYFTLLPGESREVSFDYLEGNANEKMKITAEGYNVELQEIVEDVEVGI
jgi:hypothetical protein